MNLQISSLVLALTLSTGCSTARGRFLVGAGLGGVAGGGAAVALSPNVESRGINALVFGLVGALAGGLLGIITYDDGKLSKSFASLKAQEEARNHPGLSKLYEIQPDSNLPVFVKERLQPPVVEEMTEPDTVSEDGSLHEPHKVYRIQRNAELYSNPSPTTTDKSVSKEGNQP